MLIAEMALFHGRAGPPAVGARMCLCMILTSPNQPVTRSSLVLESWYLGLLGFRYARIALAPLNHIALASEHAES